MRFWKVPNVLSRRERDHYWSCQSSVTPFLGLLEWSVKSVQVLQCKTNASHHKRQSSHWDGYRVGGTRFSCNFRISPAGKGRLMNLGKYLFTLFQDKSVVLALLNSGKLLHLMPDRTQKESSLSFKSVSVHTLLEWVLLSPAIDVTITGVNNKSQGTYHLYPSGIFISLRVHLDTKCWCVLFEEVSFPNMSISIVVEAWNK